MFFKYKNKYCYFDLEDYLLRIEDDIYYINLERAPILNRLYVKFNSNCNIKCTYCFQNNDIKSQPIKNLSSYASTLQNIYPMYDQIVVFGGEPLIPANLENLRTFLDLIHPNKIIMYTNGYHTSAIKKFLIEKKHQIDRLIITVDGIEDVHNNRRISQNYSYSSLMENIFLYNNIGVNSTIQVNLDVDNVSNLSNFIDEINSMNINNTIKLQVCLNRVLHSSTSLSNIEYLKATLNILKNCSLEFIDLIISSPMINKLRQIFTQDKLNYERCSIGSSLVVDLNSRQIYTCPQSDKTSVGNFNSNLIEIKNRDYVKYSTYSEKKTSECISCKYKIICSYGCYLDQDIDGTSCKNNTEKELQYLLDHIDLVI